MADERFALAEVRLWGRTVGAVIEDDTGRIVFEYDDTFRRGGPEISPLRLPLSLRGPTSFDELRRKESFRGLPGVLADSLPDAFGRQVMRAYYTARGEERRGLSPVQHLLYVGERAVGALTFHPAERVALADAEQEALDLSRLVSDARSIAGGGPPDIAVPEIYRIGSSAGGMRPKAVIQYGTDSGEVHSAFAHSRPGTVPAILKFDGVGTDTPGGGMGRPEPYNRIEAAYALMARDAGLDVVDVTLLETAAGHGHLVIPRFDLTPVGRLHQHTLGGLIHVDYSDPGSSSYEEYLRVVLTLGLPQASVVEGFRRMAFNVLACNQDDHVKNLSFHMDEEGVWSLTPAYDVTFAMGGGYTAHHQMRVNDKVSGITRRDLVRVAQDFSVRAAGEILDRIADVLAGWRGYATRTGVPQEGVRWVETALRERAAALGG
jgi:serine/threonine-protein kinase HipA